MAKIKKRGKRHLPKISENEESQEIQVNRINTTRRTKETSLHWISSKYLWGYCCMCKCDERTRQHRSSKEIDTSSIDSSTREDQSKGVPVGTFADSKKKSVRHNRLSDEEAKYVSQSKAFAKDI